MSANAIEFISVSKKFRKGERVDSLRDFVPNLFRSVIARSEATKQSPSLRNNEFWAVKDVSFQLKKGEALGIIGPNGAGKSTILKILSRIIQPTKGQMIINGKLSSLLEVGAGFHPDLTGRENIYLSGAIIGMKKREIDKKVDSIIEFSELDDFIDTPVKNYSSGMYVRLGFAISANLNPDILLLDEVLAVGDMSFQAKCIDKIGEFVEQKKTIIFISHNMHQVEKLCNRVILLMHGKIIFEGDANKAIDLYRSKVMVSQNNPSERLGTGEVVLSKVQLMTKDGNISNEFNTADTVIVRIHYRAVEKVLNPIFSFVIYDSYGNTIIAHMRTDADYFNSGVIEKEGFIDLKIDSLNLLPSSYVFNILILNTYDEGNKFKESI